jgi:hypothetical protein
MKLLKGSIHVADFDSAFNPFIERPLHVVSTEHVRDMFQLGNLVSFNSLLLIFLDLLPSSLLIGEVLVLV